MNTSFSNILSLAKKTGDTIIITDSEGKETVVVLSFDKYEAMVFGNGRREDMEGRKGTGTTEKTREP